MKRTQTILITTVMLSIALTSVFAVDFDNLSAELKTTGNLPFFYAQADKPSDYDPIHHEIVMEAVKMPDGMYAYRMLEYNTDDGRDLVMHDGNLNPSDGVYTTKPSIPGPTLVFTEGDSVDVTLYNNACDDFVVDSDGPGANENSLIGIHVHGVHYDISDDATYARVNMASNSAASCNEPDNPVVYHWEVSEGTEGTWPYHDHTFYQNEVGSEHVGLFGTVIVNPADGEVQGVINEQGDVKDVDVEDINKEFILWMVSSEVLGRSVFYGMEIDNDHSTNPGKQTPLWVNPPLYTEEGEKVRFHVLGLGDETHAFHLHGHRWADTPMKGADVIDVKEITPLQRHSFIITASDNNAADQGDIEPEGWMYHCHVFAHMEAGMSGMLMVVDNDELPDVGAVFTLSDEPGLWMKTLDAGLLDVLDNVLEPFNAAFVSLDRLPVNAKDGIGFAPNYLGTLSEGFADTKGRSIAVISPGETVLFNMKDSQTKHTITTLIYPTDAERIGGNGILRDAGFGHFDTQLGIRGSSFLTNTDGTVAGLDTPGLYVFVCKIHPYMFSAVVVDDPNTFAKSDALEIDLPLLDLSPNLEILTWHYNDTNGNGVIDPDNGDEKSFPINVSPATPVPLALLKTFSVIVEPTNWKDYTQEEWNVDLIPGLFTTNSSQVVVTLLQQDETLDIATDLGLRNSTGGTEFAAIITANLTSSVDDVPDELFNPVYDGVGEVWVNTQFERTVNKNHDGTPNDKPGTITVVKTSGDWEVKKKISLPEINMNHPHNMWTDTKNEVIYQTQWFDNRMAVIDRATGELIHDRFVGQSPSHVMTSPADEDGGKIYIAMNGEEQVTELDPETFEITRQISTGARSHPHGHWISGDGKYMVTPNFISLSSSIIDLENNTVEQAKHNPADPDGLLNNLILGPIATGMMPHSDKYYTANFLGNSLTYIDASDAAILETIDLVNNSTGLPIQSPVSPDGEYMVTANVLGPAGAAITVLDTASNTIVAVLPCDPGCHGVQWGANENGEYYAYVSNKFSNALIVVDPYEEDPDDMIVGKILLADRNLSLTDDKVIGYDGMGGQGVLAIPNVYEGWIEDTVTECDVSGDPCGEVSEWVSLEELTGSQREP